MKLLIRYISKLTFRRSFNVLKIAAGYLISNLIRKPAVFSLPWGVSFEVAAVCQLHCPECPVGMGLVERENSFFPFEKYEKVIKEIYKDICEVQLFFQGEPLLNKEIERFVKVADDKKLFSTISTNGQLLTQEICERLVASGLDKIIISVDGIDQDTYAKYRVNGSLDKVLEGIKHLESAKKKVNSKFPYVEIQFLAFSYNENQINDLKHFFQGYSIDKLSVKTAQIYSSEKAGLIPKSNRLSRYREVDGKVQLKRKQANRCKRLWSASVITSDGELVPCCFDKTAGYVFGNIEDSSFLEIWYSKRSEAFRHKVLTNRKGIEICGNCTS